MRNHPSAGRHDSTHGDEDMRPERPARSEDEAYDRLRAKLDGKPVPRWVTGWPEWFGVMGNVTVVPESDYLAVITERDILREENARLRAELATVRVKVHDELVVARAVVHAARLASDKVIRKYDQGWMVSVETIADMRALFNLVADYDDAIKDSK